MFVCFFKNSPLDPFSPSTSKRQSKSVPTIVQTPKCEHTFWPPNPWNADVGVFQIPAVWHYKCETVCCAGVFVMELWEIVVYLEFLMFYLAASPKTTAQVFWQIIAESVEFMFQNTLIITCRWEAFQQMFQSPQWKATVLQLREGLNEYSG